MRKGDWYLVSDDKGVVSIGHVLKIDHEVGRIDFEVYPRDDFKPVPIKDFPLNQYLTEVYGARYRGREFTQMKARDARNLLKILQRKLP